MKDSKDSPSSEPAEPDFSAVKLDIDSTKYGVCEYIARFFETSSYDDASQLKEAFKEYYLSSLDDLEKDETNDFFKLHEIITRFKPALRTVLPPGEDFDATCNGIIPIFNVLLSSAKRQITGEISRTEGIGLPVLPGSKSTNDICYFCTVCKEKFDIPPDIKARLLENSDEVTIPHHHGKEFKILIFDTNQDSQEPTAGSAGKAVTLKLDDSLFSAENLMGMATAADSDVDYLNVLSVGIDVGSSTSHLVFSRLTLRKDSGFINITNRFIPVKREVIYEGNIIFTPLSDRNTIDIDAVVKFIREEYRKAGIKPYNVDTGAVIVTGEASRKQNAAEIVNQIALETGKFVSATAGPNFEALLCAKGSGVIDRSLSTGKTIMNVDVGGGTSKLAIVRNGQVLSTASISVGAQLLGIDKEFKIWRIDDPTYLLMQELNMAYELGDTIPEKDVKIIARKYAESLLEVMQKPVTSDITKQLMVTQDMDFPAKIDEYSFSGGVAEFIYGDATEYDDIGQYLAKEINSRMKDLDLPVVEPENKIRATVIGAGAFSLSVSGSTCYVDKTVKLPVLNVPVIPVNVTYENFSPEKVEEEIARAYQNFDFFEGEDEVALYFTRPLVSSSEKLIEFAKAIEKSLPNSVAGKKKIVLLFEMDIAKVLGITIKRETAIRENLVCLDELVLEPGDWIDIGSPLREGQVFPVTVKSLVFKG
ncbi:MAG: ethanolamine ammonia-lyase reactivating factor EutA [Candidatus Odinarchaeota archaeon]